MKQPHTFHDARTPMNFRKQHFSVFQLHAKTAALLDMFGREERPVGFRGQNKHHGEALVTNIVEESMT